MWEATVAHQGPIVDETLAGQFGSAPSLDALPLGDGVVETELSGNERVQVKVVRL